MQAFRCGVGYGHRHELGMACDSMYAICHAYYVVYVLKVGKSWRCIAMMYAIALGKDSGKSWQWTAKILSGYVLRSLAWGS